MESAQPKAVSSIIASVLMLMIVIGLGATAYFFVSGTFSSKTEQTFTIIDVYNDTVTISNTGTDPITSMTGRVDGGDAWVAVIGNPDRLVGYWTLDRHGYDGSGQGNDATGSVSYVSGKKEQAVLATSGFLRADPSSSLDDAFSGEEITISVWWKQGVNTESHPWWDNIYRGLHRIEHGVDGWGGGSYGVDWWYGYWTGLYNMTNDAQSLSRSNFIVSDRWYHFVLMKNMTIMAVYIDGQLDNSRSGDFYINPVPTDDLYIARHAQDDHVDDVKIWDRALSEDEIRGLYEDSIPSGQNAVIRFVTPMSKGPHNIRLCTRSMCTTGSLMII